MTNNVAEFEGIKMILQWYLDNKLRETMQVIGDSQVVIWRMLGKYRKPVTGSCAAVATDCLKLKEILPKISIVTFKWLPRLNNDACDAMCNLEIHEASTVARQ